MGKTFEATMTVNLSTTGGLGKTYNEQLEVLKLSSSKINVKQTFIYPNQFHNSFFKKYKHLQNFLIMFKKSLSEV